MATWWLVGEVQNISLMFSTLVNSSVGKIELKIKREREREREREGVKNSLQSTELV